MGKDGEKKGPMKDGERKDGEKKGPMKEGESKKEEMMKEGYECVNGMWTKGGVSINKPCKEGEREGPKKDGERMKDKEGYQCVDGMWTKNGESMNKPCGGEKKDGKGPMKNSCMGVEEGKCNMKCQWVEKEGKSGCYPVMKKKGMKE